MTQGAVPVSLLASATRCPLRAFFAGSTPWKESPHYTICKQLSYHLGSPLDYSTIWDEIGGISPSIGEEYAQFLEGCINSCQGQDWREASENDMEVRSKRYGIFGTIDRVFSKPPYFSVIRSGTPPPSGVYTQDRVRVVAYALCLSEMLSVDVPGGTIEYIPGGKGRYCEIQPGDIRKFYSARRVVRNIDAGHIPKKPLHAPCSSCYYFDRCDPGPIRLSDRF
jgi:CRISPR-associated exonuclease Cas4